MQKRVVERVEWKERCDEQHDRELSFQVLQAALADVASACGTQSE